MDLTLVEKITHVLQNTQIRIKSEVWSSSHSVGHTCQQSEDSEPLCVSVVYPFCLPVCLSVCLPQVAASNTQCRTIKEFVVQLPNKVASSADETEVVCVSLNEVFQLVRERVEYLHCSVQHHGARVGGVEEELVTPLSSITATQAILE